MNVLLFGATGMIGAGVLIECLESDDVDRVVSLTRRPAGRTHAKLKEIVHDDFTDYSGLRDVLTGIDACFFCVGVSSAGMSEERYRAITFDITARAAEALLEASPGATFVYVSGAGADSSGRGRVMWARVRGQIENHVLGLGFAAAHVFRPAYVQPMKGVVSSTRWYRLLYRVTSPFYPLLRGFETYVTDTARIGRAMIRVARDGYGEGRIENRAINELGAG